ncbi:MAG: DUF4238 domain-containing protein [Promethearchaeota archaeon]
MNRIKIEHYVPQFYLRNFAIKKKRNQVIYCYDKFEERCFNTNIKNVGCEKNFYNSMVDDQQIIEKTLGRLERRFSKAYNKLITIRDISSLDDETKCTISFFVAQQYIRTREYRHFMKELRNSISNSLAKEFGVTDYEIRWRDEAIKNSQIFSLFNETVDIAVILLNLKWTLLINKTSIPYCTSDNPVNLYNFINHKPYRSLGFACRGINVYFPLTTDLSLRFCDPSTYFFMPSKSEIIEEQDIHFQNKLQAVRSNRFVFSKSGDFSLIRRIIKENPSLRDLNRKRISIH